MANKPLAPTQAPQLEPAVQLAIKQVYIEINKANARTDQLAAAHNTLAQTVKGQQNVAQSTQQKVASLPSFDVLQTGTSTQLKTQSSVLPAHCTGFVYVATATSISFYWDGTNGSSQIQIAWPDGSVTNVPLGNITITGLSPSTTYFFYPSYNTQKNVVVFAPLGGPSSVPLGTGTPPVAYTGANIFAAAAADGDNFQSLSDGPMQVSTPSSGMTTSAIGGK